MVDETEEVKTDAPEQESVPTPEAAPAAEETPKEKKTPWWQGRIDELTAKYRGTERALNETRAQAEGRIAQLEQALRDITSQVPQNQAQANQQQIDFEAVRRQIRAEERMSAAQELAATKFNQQCNEIAALGKKEFKDFDDKVRDLQKIDGLTPEMIIALKKVTDKVGGNPAAVIHYLGKNMDEAMQIKALSPAEIGAEMTRIVYELKSEASKAPAKKASSAPEPINPIGGATKGEFDIYSDGVDTGDWIAKRQAEIDAKNKRGGRFQ